MVHTSCSVLKQAQNTSLFYSWVQWSDYAQGLFSKKICTIYWIIYLNADSLWKTGLFTLLIMLLTRAVVCCCYPESWLNNIIDHSVGEREKFSVQSMLLSNENNFLTLVKLKDLINLNLKTLAVNLQELSVIFIYNVKYRWKFLP